MEEFWIEINLEKLKVKMEVFVSLEKVRNHCVGGMRTHTEKALNSGHSVGEHACLEACKTESTSVGFLIENLFLEIISFSRPDEVDQLLLEFAQDIFGRRENGQDMIEFRDSKLIGHENFTFKRKSRRKTFPLRESVAKFFFTDGPVLFEKVVFSRRTPIKVRP